MSRRLHLMELRFPLEGLAYMLLGPVLRMLQHCGRWARSPLPARRNGR